PVGYNERALKAHNWVRAQYPIPLMTIDAKLTETAIKAVRTCVFAPNAKIDGGGYGQNIAVKASFYGVDSVIQDIWNNRSHEAAFAPYLGQATPWDGDNKTDADPRVWGVYTQLIWHNSTRVGCATNFCAQLQKFEDGSPAFYTVCHYQDPGNVKGQFHLNVFEKKTR
ncbi:PR-1-like protein, partial [Mytilinidion resinicola]